MAWITVPPVFVKIDTLNAKREIKCVHDFVYLLLNCFLLVHVDLDRAVWDSFKKSLARRDLNPHLQNHNL